MTEPMRCGTEFYIQDVSRANAVRFIWLDGNWLAIQKPGIYPLDHPLELHAGSLGVLMRWTGVLAYLCKVAKRNEDYVVAGSQFFVLGPVLRVSELAALLGEDPEAIRKELADYILQVDDG